MKKNNNIVLFSTVVLAVFGFTACENQVDQNYPLNTNEPVVTVTANMGNAFFEVDNSATTDVDESMSTITVTANKAYNTDMKFKLEFLPNESTVSIDDFVVDLDPTPIDFGSEGYLIKLPSNEISTSFTISAVGDDFEQTEYIKFRIYPVGDLNGQVDPASEYLTLTLNNSALDLVMVFDWNKTFNYGGVDYSLCGVGGLDYDVDILVRDAAGNLVGPGAQTAECPETLAMNTADYPDGTYTISAYLYDDGPDDISQAGISPPIDIPINVTYSRQGSGTLESGGSFTQTAGFTTDSMPDDATPTPGDGTEIYVATVIVSGGVFTIVNNGTTIATGRHTNLKHVE